METVIDRYRGIVRDFDKTLRPRHHPRSIGNRSSCADSAILGEGVRILRSGDRVSFDVDKMPRGLNAVRVLRDKYTLVRF